MVLEIPFNKPFIVGKELYYIAEATLKNQRLAGAGTFTKKCERWLADRLGSSTALLTHSCTAALEMAGLLCDLRLGDEVIMPSFTFVSTANAFALRGATPVFIDIRPDTLNLDEKLLKSAVTSRTKAIVPVHYAGVACEMDAINDIAFGNGITVIEDSAHSLLSSYKDRYLGSIGDFGCLSFHETKNVICGEGGALLVNREKFTERAEIIREKGTNRADFSRGAVDKYTWVDHGSSYLPSEITAAFLWAQLEKADEIIWKRKNLARMYDKLLGPLARKGLFRLPMASRQGASNGHIYYIVLDSQRTRDNLSRFLQTRSITAIFHYVPLHSSPAGKKFARISGSMRVTDEISERLLRLPLFYQMTEAEIEFVSESIAQFYGSGTLGICHSNDLLSDHRTNNVSPSSEKGERPQKLSTRSSWRKM